MTDHEKLHQEIFARINQKKIDQEKIASRFAYHPPAFLDTMAMQRIRSVAQLLAKTIADECPDGQEQFMAFIKLEECMMYTDLAITRHGR